MIPIVMTAYNRLDTLKKTLDSLFDCKGIKGRPIRAYVDGAKDLDEIGKINEVTRFLFSQYSISIYKSKHLGLRGNSLRAIGHSLKKYDKIIFIQDDMEFAPDFLQYMDWALNEYEDRKDIMFVSGYSQINYMSCYLSPLIADSLGIWRDKFPKMSGKMPRPDYKGFAKATVPSFASNLRNIIEGKSDAFMALLCYEMYLRNSRCLHPGINKVRYMVSDSTNSKKKDGVKLNNILCSGKELDESDTAYKMIKETKNYKWSILKKFTRLLSRLFR